MPHFRGMDDDRQDTQTRRPTLSQVARAAGVSEITASRALRRDGPVARDTRERVERAAIALNYVPNRLAGTLAGAASRQVGVILPSLSNIVFADVLKGLEDRLEGDGYHPILGISNYDPLREERLLRDLLSWRPAGLVIAPARKTDVTRRLLAAADLPVVEIMDVDAESADMAVGISHRGAGRAMAHYLAGRGYRRVAYLGHGIESDFRATQRLEGFRDGLREVGVTLGDVLCLPGHSTVPLGREGLARLLAEAATPPEAVFFSNDDMAVGGAFHCQAAGIAVPEGPLSIAPVVAGDRLRIESERVSGAARRVPWGRDAGHVVVFGEAGTVALVRTGDADIDRGANVAGEPRDDLSFDGIPAVAAGTVPGLDRDRLHERGALVRSVQMAGAMDRVLVMSVQYGGERKQFGRPLAKFQAIQQQLAVLAGHAAAAGTAADAAVSAAEGDADASLAIAAAKARTSEAAGIVAGIAHQVHGAMGFTYEHALHHFTRRLWSWRDEFGNEALWNRTLGMRVAAAGGEALWPLITAT